MRTSFRVIAGALLVLAQPLAAQTVRGRVVEWGTGRAVPFATVVVLDAAGQSAGYAQSDAMGEYSVRLRAPGRYFVRARHPGYQPALSDLTRVREGRDVRRILTLRPGPGQLGQNMDRGRFPPAAIPLPHPRPPVTGAGPATNVAPGGDAAGERPIPRNATPASRPRGEERGARRPPRQTGGDRGGARRGDPQPWTRQP